MVHNQHERRRDEWFFAVHRSECEQCAAVLSGVAARTNLMTTMFFRHQARFGLVGFQRLDAATRIRHQRQNRQPNTKTVLTALLAIASPPGPGTGWFNCSNGTDQVIRPVLEHPTIKSTAAKKAAKRTKITD
jgi:hypothetical protein